MGADTAISWADHTFNPWEGCTRISPACDHCYAADRAHRFGNDRLWAGELRRTSSANWAKPRRWNRDAAAGGVPARVFCASLADVFDNQAPQAWRDDLWALIEATPHLIWMLLTKRPQNVARMVPTRWERQPPANIWLGTTAEDQARADQRIGYLLELGSAFDWLLFLSAEPLLGPLDLTDCADAAYPGFRISGLTGWGGFDHPRPGSAGSLPRLGLVIAGGESGRDARPSHPDWFRQLRDDCRRAQVPFHFKQWGEWAPGGQWTPEAIGSEELAAGRATVLFNGAFHGRGFFPENARRAAHLDRIGVGRAGRLLDGVEHLAMPTPA